MVTLLPQHLSFFKNTLGAEQVIDQPDQVSAFASDRTTKYLTHASVALFPKNTEQVSQILAYCHQHKICVVPSGGRTGLAGGAVALNGEVVLSLTKMNRIIEVESSTPYVRVEAGAITQTIQEHLQTFGLCLPIDFASKGSATIGGNLSTNVGGLRVIAYGSLRQYVFGLKVVLADGQVLDLMKKLYKNNAGFDLKQLFIASEGTLGVITEAILRVVPLPRPYRTYLAACDRLESALAALSVLRKSPHRQVAVEFFHHLCHQKVGAHLNIKSPFSPASPYYLLVEFEVNSAEESGQIDLLVSQLISDQHLKNVLIAEDALKQREFWKWRENITESLSADRPYKNDLSVPLPLLAQFTEQLLSLLAQKCPFQVCLFGHLGDGNIHINLLKPTHMPNEEFIQINKELDQHIYELVFKHEGSISAEHGIGLGKLAGIQKQFSALELELLGQFKQMLDPHAILNPGKIIPDSVEFKKL